MFFSAILGGFPSLGLWQAGLLGVAGKNLYNACVKLQEGTVGRGRMVSALYTYILLVLCSFCMSGLMVHEYDDRFIRGGQLTSISKQCFSLTFSCFYANFEVLILKYV